MKLVFYGLRGAMLSAVESYALGGPELSYGRPKA